MATATSTAIDDLFRQKTLQEIHGVLKQTRADVEAKKQELRELVGDHYRSVLESSDHIRAMSECAAKVSAGADHIEELVASMRSLAANPPTTTSGLQMEVQDETSAEDDYEYRASMRVMELLEVPDNVGVFLYEHEFVRAARLALIDAVRLQTEVDDLLQSGAHSADSSSTTFDFAALMSQQRATLRNLSSQISASCEDAFSAIPLEPGNVAESFAVRLVLESSMQPVALLRLFLERRRELVRSLTVSSIIVDDDMSCGARLAAAAMAFEGTVILGASLCSGSLEAALVAVYEGAPDRDALEERAAIEGQRVSGTGFSSLKRRGETLARSLCRGGSGIQALSLELAEFGAELAREWVPPDAGGLSSKSGVSSNRSLASFFLQLVSSDDAMRGCTALGETLKMCTEKVIDYRRVLSRGSSESWSTIWAAACEKFCPGRPPLDDALSIVTATVEAACIEIVRERIGDLQLELVPIVDDDSESLEVSAGDAQAEPGGADATRRSEICEMQRQSRLRVQHLDEQLGEILGDVAHVRLPGDEALSIGVSSALLEALRERLAIAYEAVRLPEVSSLWPNVSKDGNRVAEEFRPWPRQRSSARGAIALDAVLAASAELRDGDDTGASHLRKLLRRASSSGDAELMRRSQEIMEDLQHRSDRAYNVWARLVLTPGEGVSTLDAYWRLADDEVSHACGWGSAKFAQKTASVGSEDSKSVPVPVQASAFVFERLAQGARRALEISGGASLMSRSLVIALKTALSEAFMSCYEAHTIDFDKMKYSGMSHLLQWLFDLRFLQITLSSSLSSGSSAAASTTNKAYEALCQLHDRAEAATLSDPVDRLLYQEVLKSSVKSHVEGVKVLLAPFFLYNPRYAFLFPKAGGEGASNATSAEDDGFELQTMFGAPLRPMLPQRFPLLPVVSSALAVSSSADLDARLGLSSDSADRAAARMSGANPSAPSVSSLMQSVGSGLGSFGGFGKDSFGGFGKSLTSVWGGGTGAVNKPPEAV